MFLLKVNFSSSIHLQYFIFIFVCIGMCVCFVDIKIFIEIFRYFEFYDGHKNGINREYFMFIKMVA